MFVPKHWKYPIQTYMSTLVRIISIRDDQGKKIGKINNKTNNMWNYVSILDVWLQFYTNDFGLVYYVQCFVGHYIVFYSSISVYLDR